MTLSQPLRLLLPKITGPNIPPLAAIFNLGRCFMGRWREGEGQPRHQTTGSAPRSIPAVVRPKSPSAAIPHPVTSEAPFYASFGVSFVFIRPSLHLCSR